MQDTVVSTGGCDSNCYAHADEYPLWRYRSGLKSLTANPGQDVINVNDGFNHGYEWGAYKPAVDL